MTAGIIIAGIVGGVSYFIGATVQRILDGKGCFKLPGGSASRKKTTP
jgi:hypothetical protein